MSAFSGLFEPLRIGRKTLPSRVVFGAHQTNFGVHNLFNERHAAYYGARAAGGAGMIVLEGSVVHGSDWPYEYALFGYEGRIVAGYQLVAEAVRASGAVVLAQLTHSGQQGSSHYSQRPLWAPSPVPEVNSREVPKEMEEEDIAAVVAGFAQAAQYAIEGGLDGVEINAGQLSLLRQFMSPLTNMRQDGYGGGLEGRVRLAREVLRGVRKQIGQERIVGLRLSADEYAPWAGVKPEDAAEIARMIATDGAGSTGIDFISVTHGSIYSTHVTRSGLYNPPGFGAQLAAGIKTAVGELPVFAQGSIVEPSLALELVASGQADGVEMTRAMIADPELVKKLKEGRVEAVRPCILCNQDCVVNTVQNPRLSCSHNPAAGYELEDEFRPLQKASNPQKVLVVGGGPAGLEAARVAAVRGHQVTLVEKSETLGGALKLAAQAGRERLALAVEWLAEQVRGLGVEVVLGKAVLAEDVQEMGVDAVIVAVGGESAVYPYVEISGDAPVVSVREVLSGAVPEEAGTAVILDKAGDHAGVVAAEWLADRGWGVTVVSADMFVGQRLTATMELTPWNQRAPAKGVVFQPMVEVREVNGRTVVGIDKFGGEAVRFEDVDLVVSAGYERPVEGLYFALKEAGVNVVRAGDCVAPRRLGQAILEGYRVGKGV